MKRVSGRKIWLVCRWGLITKEINGSRGRVSANILGHNTLQTQVEMQIWKADADKAVSVFQYQLVLCIALCP